MSDLICAVWGALDDGRHDHMDCPVIVRQAGEGIAGSLARTEKLPIVCKCECHTCKRAWWAAGRPVVREGQILTEEENARRAPAPKSPSELLGAACELLREASTAIEREFSAMGEDEWQQHPSLRANARLLDRIGEFLKERVR